MNAQLPAPISAAEISEIVIAKGDISRLTAQERISYYSEVCRSIGLNPLTRPLEFLTLQGKMVLYARRDAADQLRKLHNISIEIVSQTHHEGLFSVHVRAKDGNGRADEDLGVVALPDTAKGEIRANLILKAITKAKRRVTLSISGLGFLDETEVEDIPASQRRPVESDVPSPPAPSASRAPTPALMSGPHALPRVGGMKAWSDAYLGFIRSAQSVEELKAWDDANDETLEAINEKEPSLYEIIDGTVAARMRELTPPPPPPPVPSPKRQSARGKPVSHETPKASAPPSDGDPETFISWAKSLLQTATSAEELDQIFNEQIETAGFSQILPPDQDEILGEHKRLRAKFEP